MVVLALLSEKPRHGYELNQELIRREVSDWAGISRAQVYYSVRKLHDDGLIREISGEPARGPLRTTYSTTEFGRAQLESALACDFWACQRPPQPFMTWIALSPYGKPAGKISVIRKRRQFLNAELKKERRTLEEIGDDATPLGEAARLLVSWVVQNMDQELLWLDQVEAVLGKGADHKPKAAEHAARPTRRKKRSAHR
jgi:DNA-binding PadR family transcriptional regulator